MNVFLFACTVLIWGTTWIAIAAEIGPVPVLVSVFYRFALAAAFLFVVLLVSRRLTIPALRHHPYIAVQALCLFCLNFICFYAATGFIPSGLVSVVFSLATVFNAVNARLIFGTPVTVRTMLAAALGVVGLGLLFGRNVVVGLDAGTLKGLGLAALGTLLFSLGNMASRRNSTAGLPPSLTNAWGMAYGALALLVLIGFTHTPFVMPSSGTYVLALLYLAIFGSVVGFTTYLMLVARIGPSRAAYATVLFPIVALAISTLFEDYRWDAAGVLGLAIAVVGNILIFFDRTDRPNTVRTPSGAPRERLPLS